MLPKTAKHPWIGLLGLSLLASTAFLDFTIVYTSLPAIQEAMKVPIISLQWVINIFTLALATLMVLSGKLGDAYGKRKLFFIGVLLFGIAAIGAGFSPNFSVLIVFRALQGVAAAILFTNSAALVPLSFDEKDRPKAIGIFSLITGFGLAIGPFLGGVLVSTAGWQWVFFVNIPLIIVGFILCIGNVPESEQSENKSIDWLGAVLMIASFGLLVVTIINAAHIGWINKITLSGIGVSCLLFGLLYSVEIKKETPLLDIDDAKNTKIQIGMMLCITATIMTSGMLFLVPLYIHNILGLNSFYLGLLMLCTPIMQVFVSAVWDKIYIGYGIGKPIIVAMITLILATVIQYFFSTTTSIFMVILALLLMGIIWGITNVAGIILASSAVPPQKVGGAIGLIYTNWNTSGVVVLALVTTIFTASEINYMNHSLNSHKIENLTIEEHNQLSQSLGNPNQAQAIFSKFPSSMEREVVSLFKESFIHGYKNVMIFSFFYLLVCLGITLFLLRKDKEKELG